MSGQYYKRIAYRVEQKSDIFVDVAITPPLKCITKLVEITAQSDFFPMIAHTVLDGEEHFFFL